MIKKVDQSGAAVELEGIAGVGKVPGRGDL